MSSLARLVSWMIPSLGVHDDQLRPDNSYVDRVLGAAYDIRLCEGIFKGWADHFDKCVERRCFVSRVCILRKTNTMGLIFFFFLFQSQGREAGPARAGCSSLHCLVDDFRKKVFGGHRQDHYVPRPFCVSDGVADRRRVQVGTERAGIRHGRREEDRRPDRHSL